MKDDEDDGIVYAPYMPISKKLRVNSQTVCRDCYKSIPDLDDRLPYTPYFNHCVNCLNKSKKK